MLNRRNKSTVLLLVTLVTSLMTGCSTTPTQDQRQPVPFPQLTLQDNPNDPFGFCLSKQDAAELANYIQALQRF